MNDKDERELQLLFNSSVPAVQPEQLERMGRMAEKAVVTQPPGAGGEPSLLLWLLRIAVPAVAVAALLAAAIWTWQVPEKTGVPLAEKGLAGRGDVLASVDAAAPIPHGDGVVTADDWVYMSLVDDGLMEADEDELFGSLELLHGPADREEEALWYGMYETLLTEVD